MIVEEMFALYNPWIFLQQPTHPTAGMKASFRALLAAIDQGWEIIQPVLVSDESRVETKTFHFTLMHTALGQAFHLSVAGGSEVEHFIYSNSQPDHDDLPIY